MSVVAPIEDQAGPISRALEAPRARRRRLRPAVRRLEILVAAARAMRRRGARTTVEDVAHEAGAARGTVYLYFPTWEALVLELRRLVLAEFDLRAAPLAGAPADGDWPARAEQLTRTLVDFLLGLGGLREALLHAPGLPRRLGQDADAPIARLIVAGVDAEALAVADAEATARLIYAAALAAADAIAAGERRARVLGALGELVRRAIAR